VDEGQPDVIALQVDLADAGTDRPAAFGIIVGKAFAVAVGATDAMMFLNSSTMSCNSVGRCAK